MSRPRRTMLFIPGNNPGMIQNSGILGADTIILDLEDAVSLTEKDSARILVKSAISSVNFYGSEVVVRINPLSTEYSEADIREIAQVLPHAFLVAKATEEDIIKVDYIIGEVEKANGFEEGIIKIFPLIETAYGLYNIYNIIKASKRVIGVLLGAEDLTADLGIVRTRGGEEIFYARSKVAAACKALKVDAIDTPFTDLEDMEGFILDIEKAKSIGMTGKAAINPRQIDVIHGVFAPTIDEVNYANRVIEAQREATLENKGVFSLDGKMVDAPIIARAINILNKSKLYE